MGFVKGRALGDNVLLASELDADFHNRGRITKGCLQVDISKAFDSIEWQFILNILVAFNLPPDLINWIKTCITTPYYYVALNGELSGFFPGKKGLRQGDPISSSLFVMAMDILAKELDIAVRDDLTVTASWDEAGSDPRHTGLGSRAIVQPDVADGTDDYLAHRLRLGIPESADFGQDR